MSGFAASVGFGAGQQMVTYAYDAYKNATSITKDYSPAYRKRMTLIQDILANAHMNEAVSGKEEFVSLERSEGEASNLLMSEDSKHPINMFKSLNEFERSLRPLDTLDYTGRPHTFLGSEMFGKINTYQIERRSNRVYFYEHSPNDPIHMLLQDTKRWIKSAILVWAPRLEDFGVRENFYSGLLMDAQFRDFYRKDKELFTLLEYILEKIETLKAHIIQEVKRTSLADSLKSLREKSLEVFKFGKSFMSILLCHDIPFGQDISPILTGKTIATGQMDQQLDRLVAHITTSSAAEKSAASDIELRHRSVSATSVDTTSESTALIEQGKSVVPWKEFKITFVSASSSDGITYTLEITSFNETERPRTTQTRSHLQFSALHLIVKHHFTRLRQQHLLIDLFPPVSEVGNHQAPSAARVGALKYHMTNYLQTVLQYLSSTNEDTSDICQFVSDLVDPSNTQALSNFSADTDHSSSLVRDLGVNEFLHARSEFAKQTELLQLDPDRRKFLSAWSMNNCLLVFDAYSALHRIVTMHQWFLQLEEYGKMFGNALCFSNIPISAIVQLQGDVIEKFYLIADKLFQAATKLTRQDPKFHKNMTALTKMFYTVKKLTLSCTDNVNELVTKHLNRDLQFNRMRELHQGLAPFMAIVCPGMQKIRVELGMSREALEVSQQPSVNSLQKREVPATFSMRNFLAITDGSGEKVQTETDEQSVVSSGFDFESCFHPEGSNHIYVYDIENEIDGYDYVDDNTELEWVGVYENTSSGAIPYKFKMKTDRVVRPLYDELMALLASGKTTDQGVLTFLEEARLEGAEMRHFLHLLNKNGMNHESLLVAYAKFNSLRRISESQLIRWTTYTSKFMTGLLTGESVLSLFGRAAISVTVELVEGVALASHLTALASEALVVKYDLISNIAVFSVLTLINSVLLFYDPANMTTERYYELLDENAKGCAAAFVGGVAGAAIGTALCPGVGTVVLGTLGSISCDMYARYHTRANLAKSIVTEKERHLCEMFAELGVDRGESYLVAQQIMRRTLLANHPDKHPNATEEEKLAFTEKTVKILAAWQFVHAHFAEKADFEFAEYDAFITIYFDKVVDAVTGFWKFVTGQATPGSITQEFRTFYY